MTGQRRTLCVDRDRCEGHGQCAFAAPDLVHLGDDGVLVIDQPDVTRHMDKAQRATGACPTGALRIT